MAFPLPTSPTSPRFRPCHIGRHHRWAIALPHPQRSLPSMRPRDGLNPYAATSNAAELTQTNRAFQQPYSHPNSIIPITRVPEDSSVNEPNTHDSASEVELPPPAVHSQDKDDAEVTILTDRQSADDLETTERATGDIQHPESSSESSLSEAPAEVEQDCSSTGPHSDASLDADSQSSSDTEDCPDLKPNAALEAARHSNEKSSSTSDDEEAKTVAQLSAIVTIIVVIVLWLLLH